LVHELADQEDASASRANSRAVARPMPLVAPVMMTTRPFLRCLAGTRLLRRIGYGHPPKGAFPKRVPTL
jgi:hypothetical protein